MDKINAFFQKIYHEVLGIHDSPHSIALGFGVGVFLGILPFTGVVAAVALAVVFKFNKAAALMGSLLTNTWLSVATFFIAGQLGCFILNKPWQNIIDEAKDLVIHFTWAKLMQATTLNILLPLMLGYIIVGIMCGIVAYVFVRVIFRQKTLR